MANVCTLALKTWKKTKKIFLYSVGAAIAATVVAAVTFGRVEGKKFAAKPS
jgi:hypothetical protein